MSKPFIHKHSHSWLEIIPTLLLDHIDLFHFIKLTGFWLELSLVISI